MMEVEKIFAVDLLADLDQQGVLGAVMEFGVFEGDWLERLIENVEALGNNRQIFGLDSFEGLPAMTEHDLDCWHEGQYKTSYERVSERIRLAERKHVHLLKGWFSDTILTPIMQSADSISYARIDCDLYYPIVIALEYLQTRLAHNAILVFDDWTFDLNKGETKAFYEWIDSDYVKENLRFEFICFCSIAHYYMRVSRKS